MQTTALTSEVRSEKEVQCLVSAWTADECEGETDLLASCWWLRVLSWLGELQLAGLRSGENVLLSDLLSGEKSWVELEDPGWWAASGDGAGEVGAVPGEASGDTGTVPILRRREGDCRLRAFR